MKKKKSNEQMVPTDEDAQFTIHSLDKTSARSHSTRRNKVKIYRLDPQQK